MERRDEELLKKLLPMFRVEARDHLKVISSGLIDIEKSGPGKQSEIIETIYRESHSLKGAARSVNLPNVVALCQSMESVFSALKRKELASSPDIFDLLHHAVDCAFRLVAGEELSLAEKQSVGELVNTLEQVAQTRGLAGIPGRGDGGRDPAAGKSASSPEPAVRVQPEIPLSPALSAADTVRVSAAKIDSLLIQAEEMLSAKIATGQLAGELKALNAALAQWKKERTWKRSFVQTVGRESTGRDGADTFVASFESRLATLIQSAEYEHRAIGTMVDALLDSTKKMLMVPVRSLLDIFPKLARDLSRAAGKDVEFTASGGDIQLDRRVMEEIKDPLIHLLRNCIDHGIEPPGDRLAKHKPPTGKIRISVTSADGRITIAVSDDGAGIDASEVGNAAQRSGALSAEELARLDRSDLLALVFRSGVTTSPMITDISGRGLGLAIVRERIEKLNGRLSIDTERDAGTTLKMEVPLTIATFRGVLVRVGEGSFFLPSANIEKVARVKRDEVKTVENRETIPFDGRVIPLARLGTVLELQAAERRSRPESPYIQVVVLESAGKRIAFQVDEVIHEQEVLVKNLGPQLPRVRNIAGATLLGNGKLAPILNVRDLMISAVKAVPPPAEHATGEPPKRRSVLVVEDSITARTLLKTILESAGYEVDTAVDGLDAFTALKTGSFDLVISDIEMPRMNGFDLTARIRAEKKFSEIPVVLVTALESREDKERGIEVGANAYIVKSSFEQSNLLEVVRRLV